jgi:hypothetical protein
MRLTCFPELHPTLQTPSPCTTTFSSLGSASATKPATSGHELAYPRPECAVAERVEDLKASNDHERSKNRSTSRSHQHPMGLCVPWAVDAADAP